MIHLYRVTLRTPRGDPSLLSLKNVTSVALLPGSHRSWPGDGAPGPRSLPLPAAGHAAHVSLPRLVVFAGKAMVIANLPLTFCFHSVDNARNTEPSGLNALFLAQASNEVPPLCQTKAPNRRMGGGGAVGENQGNAAFVAYRCLFVWASVRGRGHLAGEGHTAFWRSWFCAGNSFPPPFMSLFVWFGTELIYPSL